MSGEEINFLEEYSEECREEDGVDVEIDSEEYDGDSGDNVDRDSDIEYLDEYDVYSEYEEDIYTDDYDEHFFNYQSPNVYEISSQEDLSSDLKIVNITPPPMNLNPEDCDFLNIKLNKNTKYKSSFFRDLISKDNSVCSICLGPFKSNTKVISLLCAHYFHTNCIVTWIKEHNQCPCCRTSA